MLMSLELMLLAVNVNFILCSVYLDDFMGQIFALLVSPDKNTAIHAPKSCSWTS